MRAVYVEAADGLIIQMVMQVGLALFRFVQELNPTFLTAVVKARVGEIEAIRSEMPIGATIRAAYGYRGEAE